MSQGYGSNPNDPNQPPPEGYPQGADQSGYQPPADTGYQQPPPAGGYQPPAGGGYQQSPPAGGPPPGYQQAGYYVPPNMNQMSNQAKVAAGELPNKWMKVLSKPSVATFDSELPNANWPATITGLLMEGAVVGLAAFIAILLIGGTYGGYAFSAGFGITAAIVGFVAAVIGVFIVFFIGAGLAYLFGKMVFGGQGGDFTQLAYIMSLYAVPLGMVSSILGLLLSFTRVFALGNIVSLVFYLIYAFFLYLAVQSAFKLKNDAAMGVVASVLGVPLLLSLLGLVGVHMFGGYF
ncbi:MAG: hypothetical protein DLM69_07675 [Candidatus Chloroheliales bacterium]|nr:MAG: hypothetical protein DLM69_07675 [Chloroflexota bacterium]